MDDTFHRNERVRAGKRAAMADYIARTQPPDVRLLVALPDGTRRVMTGAAFVALVRGLRNNADVPEVGPSGDEG